MLERKQFKQERCSNCGYNKYNPEDKSFYCGCPESDYYSLETGYDDSCEMWERKW